MSSANVSKQIVKLLHQYDVPRIYGIVGDSLNPLTEAIFQEDGIEWIHVRHEETAAFAASAEAQLTHHFSVCCGSCGPGNLHLINGLYDAHYSHAPVLAIASHIALSKTGCSNFQETHPQQIFQECSAYSELITKADQAITHTERAIRYATFHQDVGVIVLPGDIAWQTPEKEEYIPPIHYKAAPLEPDPESIKTALYLIQRSQKIVFFCGIGCKEGRDLVIKLAQHLGAPIVFSYKGKECMDYDNPCAVGMTGLLGWGGAYEALEECDLAILWGTNFPFSEFYPQEIPLIQIDTNANHLGQFHPITLGILGDVTKTASAFLQQIHPREDHTFLDTCLSKHIQACENLLAYTQEKEDSEHLRPEYLTTLIDQISPKNSIFTIDTGTPNIWASRYLHATPHRTFLGSFKQGSMACALPMAIGAQCACPDRQVIALCGDGGLSMCLGELITVIQYKLPIKIIVYNNDSLNFIKLEMQAAGLVPEGIDLHNPNFSKIAQAAGFLSERIQSAKDLEPALRRLLTHNGPAFLDAIVTPNALALPPKITWDHRKGFTQSLLKQAAKGNLADLWKMYKENRKIL